MSLTRHSWIVCALWLLGSLSPGRLWLQQTPNSLVVAARPPQQQPVVNPTQTAPRAQVFGPTASPFGPPLPPDMAANREEAHRLLADYHAGRLTLTVPEREEAQLRALAQEGAYCWTAPSGDISARAESMQHASAAPSQSALAAVRTDRGVRNLPGRNAAANSRQDIASTPATVPEPDPWCRPPAPGLLHMLTVLASRATAQRPLELMSLLRPPYRTGDFVHVGPRNPHALGLAADIASYGGYTVRQTEPESCVAATLALLRALPPGRYRFGMPKAPEAPLIVGRPPMRRAIAEWLPPVPSTPDGQGAAAADCVTAALIGVTLDPPDPPWPFFPAPKPALEDDRVAPVRDARGEPVLDAGHRPMPAIARYRNESYVPLSELHDHRLIAAIDAAFQRGVEIIAAFPDGTDHIHIDVQQHL